MSNKVEEGRDTFAMNKQRATRQILIIALRVIKEEAEKLGTIFFDGAINLRII